MGMTQFHCPHCGRRLTIDQSFVGQETVCPTCDALFAVPQFTAAPPAASQEAVGLQCTRCGALCDEQTLGWSSGAIVCTNCLLGQAARTTLQKRRRPARSRHVLPTLLVVSLFAGGGFLFYKYVREQQARPPVVTIEIPDGDEPSDPQVILREMRVSNLISEGNHLIIVNDLPAAKGKFVEAQKLIGENPTPKLSEKVPTLAASISRIDSLTSQTSSQQSRLFEMGSASSGPTNPPDLHKDLSPTAVVPPPGKEQHSIFDDPAEANQPPTAHAPPPPDLTGTREVSVAHTNVRLPSYTIAMPPNGQNRRANSGELGGGWELVRSAHYTEAQARFEERLRSNRDDPGALHGKGVCLLLLGQTRSAREQFKRAYVLRTPDRALTVNYAAAWLDESAMTAAKLLRNFVARPGPVDEDVQNAFGTALSHATPQARKLAFFQDSVDAYREGDRKLEMARADGLKRWGMRWLPADQAEANWRAIIAASGEAKVALEAYEQGDVLRRQSWETYRDVFGDARLHSTEEIRRGEANYRRTLQDEETLRDRLNQATTKLQNTEQPPFPLRIEIVLPGSPG